MTDAGNPPAGTQVHLALTFDEARWLRDLLRHAPIRADDLKKLFEEKVPIPGEPAEDRTRRAELFRLLSAHFTTP